MPRLRRGDDARDLEDSAEGTPAPAGGEQSSRDYGELAPHVAAVLEVAAASGDRIRQDAEVDAQRIIDAAQQTAGKVLHDAEALRAQMDEAAVGAHERAEVYAERKRRDAEAEARKILEEAEEIAARQLGKLVAREDELRDKIEASEQRVASLVAELHELLAGLEGVVADRGIQQTLDDALKASLPETSP
jgi:cell division septum initiation protein DivIVA